MCMRELIRVIRVIEGTKNMTNSQADEHKELNYRYFHICQQPAGTPAYLHSYSIHTHARRHANIEDDMDVKLMDVENQLKYRP